MKRLSVLLATIVMSGRSGTEIVTRNLATGLMQLGHRPVVYTSRIGPLAQELRRISIPVVDDIGMIAEQPDIIHGHHHPTLVAAAARFPETPAIFFCHDFIAWQSIPPDLPQIRRWLAMDETTADRLVFQHGISRSFVEIVPNCVDPKQFRPTRTLPPRPLRALAYTKSTAHIDAVKAACDMRGLQLDVVGQAAGELTSQPELLLPQYDIVFATGLSALEAMACGTSVIICDGRGLAGMVTPERFATWRTQNFGLRTLSLAVTPDAIAKEIDHYEPTAAAKVSALVRERADLGSYVQSLVALYEQVITEAEQRPQPDRDAHRIAIARYIERWNAQEETPRPWLDERRHLLEQILRLRSGLGRVEYEKPIMFGAGGADDWCPLYGFSRREEWGVWTISSRAALLVGLPAPCQEGLDIAVRLLAFVRQAHPKLECSVSVNGYEVALWQFNVPEYDGRTTERTFTVPAAAASSGVLCLSLSMSDITSPKALGISDDARTLGIGLQRLTVFAKKSSL
jgi:hypothetical protein